MVQSQSYKKCMQRRKSLRRQGKLKGTLCDKGYCAASTGFAKYPSAYANLYAAKVCKESRGNPRSKNSKRKGSKSSNSLKRWQREKWVDVCSKDSKGRHPPCSNRKSKKYPFCRPSKRISSKTPVTSRELSAEQKRRLCSKKRKQPQKKMRSLKRKRSYGRRH
jgi:hypothetical protein